MSHVVYIITNDINTKVYIGKTHDVRERWTAHRSQPKRTPGIKGAMLKHGVENFYLDVIESGLTEAQANDRERFHIARLKSNTREYGYNLSIGGEGSPGYRHTPEALAKISAASKGERNARFGKPSPMLGKIGAMHGRKHSIESKAKMGRSGAEHHMFGKHPKGKPLSAEHIEALRKSRIGLVYSAEAREKMGAATRGKPGHRLGKKASAETRVRMSVTRKGVKRNLTDEQRARIGAANRGRKHTDEARRNMATAAQRRPKNQGHPHTEEAKKRMSALAKARGISDELRAKMIAARQAIRELRKKHGS